MSTDFTIYIREWQIKRRFYHFYNFKHEEHNRMEAHAWINSNQKADDIDSKLIISSYLIPSWRLQHSLNVKFYYILLTFYVSSNASSYFYTILCFLQNSTVILFFSDQILIVAFVYGFVPCFRQVTRCVSFSIRLSFLMSYWLKLTMNEISILNLMNI